MNKGEYVGKDGRTYRVIGIDAKTEPYQMDPYTQAYTQATGDHKLFPHHPDFTAAKAALDELIEAEADLEHGRRKIVMDAADSHGYLINMRFNASKKGALLVEGRFHKDALIERCEITTGGNLTIMDRVSWEAYNPDESFRGCVIENRVRPEKVESDEKLEPLIEAEAEEWVYLDRQRRIHLDGSEGQAISIKKWENNGNCMWVQAYRKGREVALAECDDRIYELGIDHKTKMERVRELGREINAADSRGGDFGIRGVLTADWERIVELAKAVKLP